MNKKIYDFLFAMRFCIYKILNLVLMFIPNLILKMKHEYVFVMQNHGIGDYLTLTSILYYLGEKNKVSVISVNSDIYKNLGVKNIGFKKNFINGEIISFLGNSYYSNIIGYSNGNHLNRFNYIYKRNRNKEHIRDQLLTGRKDVLNKIKKIPYNVRIIFMDEEIRKYEQKYEDILKTDYAIIVTGCSNPKKSFIEKNSTKIYATNNFQKIVDMKKIKFIQLGIIENDKLENVFDLRGKTSLRETFFIVSKSKFILCSEGMFTHLSSAFDVPCITIFSGYLYPELSMYDNVIPIVPRPLPKCAYCFRNKCDLYDYPICLKNIHNEDIISAIDRILKT